MEKNVVVLDEFGNVTGTTYPKRAKGLVNKGRAEVVDADTIRILSKDFCPPLSKEDNEMSNVICFNARDFRFDKSDKCENEGGRMFVTDMFGESVEVYELGRYTEGLTQIYADKSVERDASYVFRFTVVNDGKPLDSEVSQFIVVPISREEISEDDWENRYVYNLSHCEYKPLMSKKWDSKLVAVYEIPIRTDGFEKVRFIFSVKNASLRVFPGRESECYKDLSDFDFSYTEWINGTKEKIEKSVKDLNVDQTVKEVGHQVKESVTKISKSVWNGLNSVFGSDENKEERHEAESAGNVNENAAPENTETEKTVQTEQCSESDDQNV
ncbi:MAG: hypothetical protein J6033_06925 [Lachnospiraceae bacterium]|nr:hypothetical protein [Lachnospiraceae bacterium]